MVLWDSRYSKEVDPSPGSTHGRRGRMKHSLFSAQTNEEERQVCLDFKLLRDYQRCFERQWWARHVCDGAASLPAPTAMSRVTCTADNGYQTELPLPTLVFIRMPLAADGNMIGQEEGVGLVMLGINGPACKPSGLT